MNYNSALLISIDALTFEQAHHFEPLCTTSYQNYFTSNTWTLPSHAGMLSGIFLPHLYFYKQKDIAQYKNYVKNLPTLATIFKNHGFSTKAYTGGGWLSKFFGWGKDWDVWHEATDEKSEWTGERIPIKPNEFIFAHTFYIHDWFKESKELSKAYEKVQKNRDNKDFTPDVELFQKKGKKAYIKRVKTLAKRLSWIKELPKDTLVVITSDHGELFFESEHSYFHGNSSLKSKDAFHVPLLLKEVNPKTKAPSERIRDLYLPTLIQEKMGVPLTHSLPKVLIDGFGTDTKESKRFTRFFNRAHFALWEKSRRYARQIMEKLGL